MTKRYFCFVYSYVTQMWYTIPVKKRDRFYELEEIGEEKYMKDEFGNYISLHPVNYMFNNIELLKEKNE